MKEALHKQLFFAVMEALAEMNTQLHPQIRAVISQAAKMETQANAKSFLFEILENDEVATWQKLPLCQDTGMIAFFVEVGGVYASLPLTKIFHEATQEAYREFYFRQSLCDPLTRKPHTETDYVSVHYQLREEEMLRIRILVKGGGSENATLLKMLSPSVTEPEIVETLCHFVASIGSSACPPYFIGIGLGGIASDAVLLSKEMLFSFLEDAPFSSLESRMLTAVNQLGIGAGGLGGLHTALGVRVGQLPCHIATLPMAISLNCHSLRIRELTF